MDERSIYDIKLGDTFQAKANTKELLFERYVLKDMSLNHLNMNEALK